MDAKKCDMCDAFYIPEKFNPKVAYPEGRPILKVEIIAYGLDKSFDVCNECATKLRNLIGWDKTVLR